MIHAPVPDDEDDWVLSYELAYRVAAIDATVCDRLVDLCGHYPCERPMVAGHDAAQRKRLGDMRRLPRDDDTEWVYRLLHGLVRDANDRVFGLELTDLVKPPQYVSYFAGRGRFDWHNDQGVERPNASRKMTISIQLSEPHDYLGGRLELFDAARSVVPDVRGSVAVFPSFVYHRVTPIRRGERRALVAWMGGPSLR